MRIFVTGATGFIGSHLCRLLVREGCDVLALVRPGADLRRIEDVLKRVRLIQGDLRSPWRFADSVQRERPEVAFHLAWYAEPGKYLHGIENLQCLSGSLELLQVLQSASCGRVVIAGTCLEYDIDWGRLAEAAPTRPRTLYAASKHALFTVCEHLRHQSQCCNIAWARLFYQYGPWEDSRRFVPHVVNQLLAGRSCELTSGNQVRDYLHVEDVASALLAVCRSDVSGAVNIGSSVPVTVREIATIIGQELSRMDGLCFGAVPDRPGDPQVVVAATDCLRSATGWSPHYSIRDGLLQTVAWWREHRFHAARVSH